MDLGSLAPGSEPVGVRSIFVRNGIVDLGSACVLAYLLPCTCKAYDSMPANPDLASL